jgi:hypothetical protein
VAVDSASYADMARVECERGGVVPRIAVVLVGRLGEGPVSNPRRVDDPYAEGFGTVTTKERKLLTTRPRDTATQGARGTCWRVGPALQIDSHGAP